METQDEKNKATVTITMDQELKQFLVEESEKENRSLSGQISYLIKMHYQERFQNMDE